MLLTAIVVVNDFWNWFHILQPRKIQSIVVIFFSTSWHESANKSFVTTALLVFPILTNSMKEVRKHVICPTRRYSLPPNPYFLFKHVTYCERGCKNAASSVIGGNASQTAPRKDMQINSLHSKNRRHFIRPNLPFITWDYQWRRTWNCYHPMIWITPCWHRKSFILKEVGSAGGWTALYISVIQCRTLNFLTTVDNEVAILLTHVRAQGFWA